jgi:hypothetical protein
MKIIPINEVLETYPKDSEDYKRARFIYVNLIEDLKEVYIEVENEEE